MAKAADSRLIADIYGYFVRGRQLIIVEFRSTPATDPEEPSYMAPADTHVDSLMLEYTSVPDTSGMTDESDEVPVDDIIAKAIVDFLKAEMEEDPKMKEYYLNRFTQRVVRFTEGRVGGASRIMPNRNLV